MDRLNGYRYVLANCGLRYDPELVKAGGFKQDKAYEVTKSLIESDPPTAIFASADIMALGTIEAIKTCGLSAPEDVSVFGFDDGPVVLNMHPPLSTVRQPFEDMGRTAMKLLIKKINGE